MLGRRVLALLVAVLCIVARVAVEARGPVGHQVEAQAEPGLVGRSSSRLAAEPHGPEAPEGLAAGSHAAGSPARLAVGGPSEGSRGMAVAPARRGDPRASRGPPSFVAS